MRERRRNKNELETLRDCPNGAKRFRLNSGGEKPLAVEMGNDLLVDI